MRGGLLSPWAGCCTMTSPLPFFSFASLSFLAMKIFSRLFLQWQSLSIEEGSLSLADLWSRKAASFLSLFFPSSFPLAAALAKSEKCCYRCKLLLLLLASTTSADLASFCCWGSRVDDFFFLSTHFLFPARGFFSSSVCSGCQGTASYSPLAS